METKTISTLNKAGAARMVDVSDKATTLRTSVATGVVVMKPETLDAILTGGTAKGDVLAVARVAGILAAKRTGIDLIPLCHPLTLDAVSVDLEPMSLDRLLITAKVVVTGHSGVEMEALSAVSLAALTVYDMCKAIDKEMAITDIRLAHKTGGRSGDYHRDLPSGQH